MQYLVKVHCCGAHWIAHVPALDCWTLIRDKRQIRSTVCLMVADVVGVTPDAFGVDLSEGQAVTVAAEFSAGDAVRWIPSKDEPSVSAAALPRLGDGKGWCQST
ncbi:MAG: Uncharacterized protein JWN03_7863 [Nocardia sp.]|uniref:hypothetical protein n=1 Tax=Nocardia sp. TaxID=1821 RepID=UPI00260D4869|nr:hypothetical protein [Nocardia sp.]MCU1647588.1 Uncharacterized protein [Nocardia sp.]